MGCSLWSFPEQPCFKRKYPSLGRWTMPKKVFGLASLLLLIILLGAACTPTVSQKDLQELQYKVQALSLSLATTQSNLLATEEALRNIQNQNQQLQNQLQQTSSECTTCDKTAQACVDNIMVSPYGCISTSPYCSNPCSYQPTCTPIGFSPYIFGCPYNPWINYVSPCPYHPPSPCPHPHPSPCPQPHPSPCPHPHPSPEPHPQSATFPQPIAPDVTVNIFPAAEPMASSPITAADPPAIVTTETTPAATDSVEPAVESLPAPEPELATYTMPVDVPDEVIEATASTPVIIEPPAIIDVPDEPEPETLQTAETASEPVLETTPAAVPLVEITPESVVAELVTPTPEPVLATYPMPAAVAEPVLEATPSVPAISDYPVITEIPAAPVPPVSETAKAIDETNPDSAL